SYMLCPNTKFLTVSEAYEGAIQLGTVNVSLQSECAADTARKQQDGQFS
ncbi:hypothetical protein ALP41_00138, partial [Pseudomonas savastanoi pv. nerii]